MIAAGVVPGYYRKINAMFFCQSECDGSVGNGLVKGNGVGDVRY